MSTLQSHKNRFSIWVVAIICVLMPGCGFFPESSFTLSSDSRLPKWFVLSSDQSRSSVSVKMDYYIKTSDRTATFTLADSNGTVISKMEGKALGMEPIQLRNPPHGFPSGYPSYEVITVNGITEVIEHRKMEPIFYVTDDPLVLNEILHGNVQNAEAAIKIAVEAWIPIYGEKKISGEKPYRAVLNGNTWIVQGSLPDGYVGGVAEAEIAKSDGKILRLSHSK